MNGRPISGDRLKAARNHRGSVGLFHVPDPLSSTRLESGTGIFAAARRQISRLRPKVGRSNGKNGASIHSTQGCFTVSIQDFKNLFRKKTEDSMQERAEKSRETDKLETQFDETTRNLEELIAEISNKKKHNG